MTKYLLFSKRQSSILLAAQSQTYVGVLDL